MERKIYIVASGLVVVAAFALAIHVLRIKDLMPEILTLRGRHYGYAVPRAYYVGRLLLDAMLLPLICALFGYVAHRGQEVDIVSWFFVAGFYAGLWWLNWQADHAYQMNASGLHGAHVGSVSDPTYMIGLAIAAGLGFWKLKQDSLSES